MPIIEIYNQYSNRQCQFSDNIYRSMKVTFMILPITITFICPIESVIGPEKTRKGSDVTMPTATVHPIIKRED